LFDAEKSESHEGRQAVAAEDEPAIEAGEELEAGEGVGPARTGRFSPEEARRREPREVRPRSFVLAPPPPGI
jgi:hypothetical protein